MSESFQTRLARSRDGDEAASAELFACYVDQLTRMARARISPQLGRRIDPEDVVHSAYRSFFVRLRDDRFDLDDSLDLWRLLVRIVHTKLARAARYHRAERRNYEREQLCKDFHTLLQSGPSVDEVVVFNEQVANLLAQFGGQTRRILELKLQGCLQLEIAEQLGCSERTVRRALNQVRDWMTTEMADSSLLSKEDTPGFPSTESTASFVSDSQYLIQKFVGQGGYGRVYRSLDRSTGETVAVKFLKKKFQHNREAISQFLTEAEAAARFNTPGIVPIRATGRTKRGQLFLVMKFIEGDHLGMWPSNGRPQWSEIRTILKSVVELLVCVHERGLLHLDIKPQNLLMDSHGQVWLTDFGTAQFGTCAPALLRGTLPYMAPEQIDSAFGPVSRRTDLYGLGTVLFHLLTKDDFIRGETVSEYCSMIVAERRASEIAVRLPDSVPSDLAQLCYALLERDPEQRPPSATEVRRILMQYRNE